jgi:glycine cleavage system aminomethyltransferase T
MDMSAFAKCDVSGPNAERWLSSILTNSAPNTAGRVTLTYLLTERGGVRAEFTLTRVGPDRFYLISAGSLETHDFDVLEKLLPADNSVRIDKVTTQRGVLVLAGPRSREVLAKVADIDVSNKAFPWLTARRLSIGAAGLIAMRVNFVGELGYELHHPTETQNTIFDALMAAGARSASSLLEFARWIRCGWKSPTSSSGESCRSSTLRWNQASNGSSISTKARFSAATRSSRGRAGAFRTSWSHSRSKA